MRGSYTWSHYYGNFDQDNSSRRPTTPTSSSGRRTSATARAGSCGTSGTARCAAIGRTSFKIYGYYTLPWNATAGAYIVAQSGQPWESVELRAVHRAHDDHERHRSLRRTGGLAAHGRALADRSELHAELSSSSRALQRPDRGGPVQRRRTSRPATTSSRRRTTRRSARRGPTTIRGASSGVAIPVLIAGGRHPTEARPSGCSEQLLAAVTACWRPRLPALRARGLSAASAASRRCAGSLRARPAYLPANRPLARDQRPRRRVGCSPGGVDPRGPIGLVSSTLTCARLKSAIGYRGVTRGTRSSAVARVRQRRAAR